MGVTRAKPWKKDSVHLYFTPENKTLLVTNFKNNQYE